MILHLNSEGNPQQSINVSRRSELISMLENIGSVLNNHWIVSDNVGNFIANKSMEKIIYIINKGSYFDIDFKVTTNQVLYIQGFKNKTMASYYINHLLEL